MGLLDHRWFAPRPQALVDELELKLDQDARLVKEVGERFREECCEKQACQTDYAAMKKAIQERAALQQEMLQNRHRQHETLQRSNAASTLRLTQVSARAQRSPGPSPYFVWSRTECSGLIPFLSCVDPLDARPKTDMGASRRLFLKSLSAIDLTHNHPSARPIRCLAALVTICGHVFRSNRASKVDYASKTVHHPCEKPIV